MTTKLPKKITRMFLARRNTDLHGFHVVVATSLRGAGAVPIPDRGGLVNFETRRRGAQRRGYFLSNSGRYVP